MTIHLRAFSITKEQAAITRVAYAALIERGVVSPEGREVLDDLIVRIDSVLDSFPSEAPAIRPTPEAIARRLVEVAGPDGGWWMVEYIAGPTRQKRTVIGALVDVQNDGRAITIRTGNIGSRQRDIVIDVELVQRMTSSSYTLIERGSVRSPDFPDGYANWPA